MENKMLTANESNLDLGSVLIVLVKKYGKNNVYQALARVDHLNKPEPEMRADSKEGYWFRVEVAPFFLPNTWQEELKEEKVRLPHGAKEEDGALVWYCRIACKHLQTSIKRMAKRVTALRDRTDLEWRFDQEVKRESDGAYLYIGDDPLLSKLDLLP